MPTFLSSDSTANHFDSAWYLSQYPDVRTAGVDPYEHFIMHGQTEGRLPYELASVMLEKKLLYGFSEPALEELHTVFANEKNPAYERSYASWAIAQWYIASERWATALPYLVFSYTSPAKPFNSLIVATSLIEAFIQTQQISKAQKILHELFIEFEQHPDIYLCAHNILSRIKAPASAEMQLKCVNKLYSQSKLSTLKIQDPSLPASLDNLMTVSTKSCSIDSQKVTVIVPTYNSAAYIITALRGIQEQTWRNLEVIIVDDNSDDNTLSVLKSFVKSDLRFKVFQQKCNQGAYAARNFALQYATGDFIINHDSDDWSHPQRIQLQVEHLLSNKTLMGVMTSWVRTEPNLYFPRWRTDTNLIHTSVSTLMVRKEVFDQLGHWDSSRAGADSEFLSRLRMIWGESCIGTLSHSLPFVLARVLKNSLTNAPATHLRTQYGGVRKIYDELASRWRLRNTHTGLYVDPLCFAHSTKVPASLRAHPTRNTITYDFVLYDDFSQLNSHDPRLELIHEMFRHGLNIGIFHWPIYKVLTNFSIASAFIDLALDGFCDLISAQENIESEHLLILNPAILAVSPDFLPLVKFNVSKIVEPIQFKLDKTCLFADFEAEKRRLRDSEFFSNEWYLSIYPDVAKSQTDPIEHYLKHGATEGRAASPDFDCDRYLSYFPNTLKLATPPFLHYLRVGSKFAVNPAFPSYSGIPFKARKPTVLLCGHASNLNLFGAELSLLDLLASYAINNVNVVTTLPSSANTDYINQVRQNCYALHIIPSELWSHHRTIDNRAIAKFQQLIIDYNVALVHVNTIMLHEPLIASRRAAVANCVHVRESVMHDPTLCNHIGLTPTQIIESIHDLADYIITNSKFTFDNFHKPGKTFLVRNAIDTDAFNLANTIDSDHITIALISSNLPKKGIFDFVKIAERLVDHLPNARFALIGPDNEHIKKIPEHFIKIPSNLIISHYANSPQAAISQANVVLNLSHFEETFGRTVLEAMAAGRPVIAYNHGALSELVSHELDGFLVPYLDVSAVCQLVKMLCSHPPRILSMGNLGRRKAFQNYSLKSMAEQLSLFLSALPLDKAR